MTQLRDSDFEFFMPAGLTKGRKVKTEKNPLDEWRVGGLASTEHQDLDDERLMQKGIELSYLESGWGVFNWNHEKGPENLLGPVDYVEQLSKGLWSEGYLWQHQDRAKTVFNIFKSVPEGAPSPLGFSVQGKVRQRDDNGNIAKCLIRAVAITHCPVNQHTYADLLKTYEDDYQCLTPHEENCTCPACVAKALDVGTSNPPVGADALRTESLEKDVKKKRKKKRKGRGYRDIEKSLRSGISKSQALELVLSKRPNYTRDAAESFIDWLWATMEKGVL